ncbi:MAG: nitroreductase family protein [Actinobacteria bacterium]|nr:nitroreductase family protein [Actinomycetota bacterium]
MDVFDAIRDRRSHRAFEQKPVEPEKIDLILEAAQWAPSPANSQPWEFIVITDGVTRSRIAALSEEARGSGSVEIHGYSFVRPAPYLSEENGSEPETIPSHQYSLAFMETVPVMIAVVGNPHTSLRQASTNRPGDGYKYACAAAIQNMLLAAQAQGLGSLWFTFFDRTALSQFLNVPADKNLISIVFLGYPSADPPSPGRYPLKKIVRRLD